MKHSGSERECFVVLWDLKKQRTFLMYEKLIVKNEHAALHWIFTIEYPNGFLIVWSLQIAEFNLQVKYKKGKANT